MDMSIIPAGEIVRYWSLVSFVKVEQSAMFYGFSLTFNTGRLSIRPIFQEYVPNNPKNFGVDDAF